MSDEMTVRPNVWMIRVGLMPRTELPGRCQGRQPFLAAPGYSGRRLRLRAWAPGRPVACGEPRDPGKRIGCFRVFSVRTPLIAGMLHKKMNTEASRKGDHPLRIAEIEWCRIVSKGLTSWASGADCVRGFVPVFQARLRAATPSGKRPSSGARPEAAMMSTKPDSW